MRRPSNLGGLLWALLALFVLRVAGQAAVAFFQVGFLPPMERWYSGFIPYPYLLASQVVLILIMMRICLDFTRQRGWFYQPKRTLGVEFLWFGYVYLAVMIARFVFIADRMIPIVFHWVLAAFVIVVGHSHRRRLRK